MKFFVLIFFHLVVQLAFGQNSIIIELKDGSVRYGIGRIKNDDTVLFRATKDAEKEIYDDKTLKKLTIFYEDEKVDYEYKVIEGFDGLPVVRLMKILLIGKVNLHCIIRTGSASMPGMNTGFGNGFGNAGFGFSMPYSSINYFISKTGEDQTIDIGRASTYSKKIKKLATDFFSDCPDLIEKINSKHFERYGIEDVVRYYNNDCK